MKGGVGIVAGSACHSLKPGCFRLCVSAVSEEDIVEEAVKRMAKILEGKK